jgi:hypothetical protein
MYGRWLVAALLGGFLLGGGGGVRSAASAPEWRDGLERPNPAFVVFQPPTSAGEVESSAGWLAGDPARSAYLVSYASPDRGFGAAALSYALEREEAAALRTDRQTVRYTWGQQWTAKLAAGVGIRWEKQQTTAGWPLPAESGFGSDVGMVYRLDRQTWVGLAARDLGDTVLRSPGGTATILPLSLNAAVGRQATPELRLTLEGRDLASRTAAGTTVQAGAEYRRGGTVYRLSGSAGASPAWSLGLSTALGRYRLAAGVNGAGERLGGMLGVTARW